MFDNVPEENVSVSDKIKQGAEGSVSETNKAKKYSTVDYIIAGLLVAGFIGFIIYTSRKMFKK